MGRSSSGTTDLEKTRESLASWRRRCGGRGRRIPVALWSEARELARVHGVAHTARALRLDEKRLAAMVEQAPLAVATSSAEPSAFVELAGMQVGVARDAAVVEFVAREGDLVRVQVVAGAVDLVGLARAFWGRRP